MGLDSVEIMVSVEKAFGIELTNEDARRMATVGDLYEIVSSHFTTHINREEMKATINRIVADIAGFDIEKINPSQRFAEDLGID